MSRSDPAADASAASVDASGAGTVQNAAAPIAEPETGQSSVGPSTTEPPLLQLAEVTRSVWLPDGTPLEILRGVDLSVRVGDHVSIVGRSGSGKSTLLNLLGLLDEPTSGEIRFEGVPLGRLSTRARDIRRGRDIGFIFQQFNLLPGRTALENAMLPLMYTRGRDFWRRERIAAEVLDRVGLGHRLQSTPDRLSGGEQQRVAIARALVRRPRLILADEPTGALDVETGASVMGLLDDIAEQSGAALITITHDHAVAALADRHLRLSEGRLHPVETVATGAGDEASSGAEPPGSAAAASAAPLLVEGAL